MTTKLTTRQAIEQVLIRRRKPMRVPAIIDEAVPLSRPAGRRYGGSRSGR
jgi:hypothetical protein